MASAQEQGLSDLGQEGVRMESVWESAWRVPSQREPVLTLLRYVVQSVSAWDHSPQRVGPKLEEGVSDEFVFARKIVAA